MINQETRLGVLYRLLESRTLFEERRTEQRSGASRRNYERLLDQLNRDIERMTNEVNNFYQKTQSRHVLNGE